ncbi:MAG: DUF262 domain-containing protein [Eubacterium sp.]|nr:DUF262 domain-containing protein [Eubacterium sp.]
MSRKILEPHMWNLENLFKAIYYVPVYQRPYSWDKEQVEVLLKDIYEAYKSDEREDGYYTGNIIIYDKNDKVNGTILKYDIIDGQQRITTFSLILLAVYSIARNAGIPETDLTVNAVKSSLWKIVNREYKKELCVVSLNSIEKKCFSDLFNAGYDNPEKLLDYCGRYQCASKFDQRIISNFVFICQSLRENVTDTNKTEILDYADFILQYVQFIAIEANCKENKVFSMFESINSKGKKLEQIDLIKTYIFSKLDEASYAVYLDKWGELITKTNDNLYDYLYNFIKAFLCFYRQSITIENFKTISIRDLFPYYKVHSENEAFKRLLDDMYEKVEFYNMLSSTEKAYSLVKNNKFRFFFKVFVDVSYKHPKALFLRTLIEYKKGKLSKEDVIDIVSETISFMIKFLTVSSRDSKDAITMFSGIMAEIYSNNKVVKDSVVNALAAEYLKQGITTEKLKDDINSLDAYEQNRKITIALLSLYDSTSINNNKAVVSYDQAYTLLASFTDSFSLDHLLVQTPKADSTQYKYFKDEDKDVLVLKDGHDFPDHIVIDGMDYDTFMQNILNRIGNLRIYYRDKNSRRQNTAISLKEYPHFNSYGDIQKRSDDLANKLFDICLPQPEVDLTHIQKVNRKKMDLSLPKMDKLIEFNMVKPGDRLYITLSSVDREDSLATLLDAKYVLYKNEKMTLNRWGCKVTGWKSIRIYAWAAKEGEIETLQEKRMAYVQEHNEAVR